MPFQKYHDYIRHKYHCRVQKITVDAGLTCPNRDGTLGTTGCTYCANHSFAPTHLRPLSITAQLEHGIRLSKHRYKKVDKYFGYFQAYSNTYAPLPHLQKIFEEALAVPGIVGLCIGTRPDCIDEAKIAYLATLAQTKKVAITLEFGLESIFDATLQKINRGHSVQCFCDALHLAARYQLLTTAHIILGFPDEPADIAAQTGIFLSKLPLNFLKIHQLEILRSTPLGKQYQAHPFPCLTQEAYLQAVIDLITHLKSSIILDRLCNEGPRDLVLAPSWHLTADQIIPLIEQRMIAQNLQQGMYL